MQTKRIDVLWNYTATFFKFASSAILLPVILRVLPAQDVGIWAIFSSLAALIFLLDFGFNSSFSRNVTYVLSGVQSLKKEGFHGGVDVKMGVNYALLKGVLEAMRWFYSRVAVLLLVLLLTAGSFYINFVLKGYSGDKTQVVIAWILFCVINTYNLYTLYYDALLEGKGLIKIAKQITIVGNVLYLIAGSLLVWNGFGLISLVLAQLLSVIVIRIISYKVFFTKELVNKLREVRDSSRKDVLNAVYPNAFKYGVTSLGGFMIQKSSVFIGSVFITLTAIASYGITKQLIDILVAVANITLVTYLPQITRLRVDNNTARIKEIYLKGIIISNGVFVLGAAVIIFFGQYVLNLLNSNTHLVSQGVIISMAFSSLIGLNAGISGAIISTKNEIPFMKPSIYSGIGTVILLLFIFNFTNWGVLGMALAPGLVDLCYQGWKWPSVVFKELKITASDIKNAAGGLLMQIMRK